LKGCNNRAQAWQEGKYRLRLNNIASSVVIGADVEAIVCNLGQVIMVQHDVPGWGDGGRIVAATSTSIILDKEVYIEPYKEYRILIRYADDTSAYRAVYGALFDDIPDFDAVPDLDLWGTGPTNVLKILGEPLDKVPEEFDLWVFGEATKVGKPYKLIDIKRSGDLKYTLTSLQYIDEIYTEAEDVPKINYSNLETTFEVENLIVSKQSDRLPDGTVKNSLVCAWQVPRGKIVDSFQVYYDVDGLKWVAAGSTKENSFLVENVKADAAYTVKVCTVKGALTSEGAKSNPVEVTKEGLKDSDGYPIIGSDGKLNGQIIASGILDTDAGMHNVYLTNTTIGEGKKLIVVLQMLEGVIFEHSNYNAQLKSISDFKILFAADFIWVSGTVSSMSGFTLGSGVYDSIYVIIYHKSKIVYNYADTSPETYETPLRCYYEIKEVSE
jgi:hypothetical protein